MPAKKHTSLDRVLGRFDSLDPVNMSNLVQRLARERRLLENIFNVLKEGVIVVDADGRVEYANPAAARMIGLPGGELDDVVLWRLAPGLRPAIDIAAGAKDAAGQTPHAMTREIELSYPEPRVLRLYMVPFRPEGKTPRQQYAVILADITSDREKTEQRIEDERTSSIRLLAAGVAHELGNPLNSLTIHLQLIERRLRKLQDSATKNETGALAESICVCQEEVRRLDGIIAHFLEAIRPRPPDLCETNIGEALTEELRFQQRELEDRGITVEVEVAGDLPLVMADRNQLKQVFFNINKNAMEAMRPGGVLRIKAHADDDNVYLVFGDTGGGIKQADLAKLFEPYHTTKANGHGLGLMIVQRIMREHGGQISIQSREGEGTSVTLQLPRKGRRVRMLK